jgi:transposase
MALSDDLRKRVVEAVVSGGLSRNSAAKRFEVGIASAVRWVKQFEATGEMSPKPLGGDRRSGRIEAHHDYLMGLIRRTPDITQPRHEPDRECVFKTESAFAQNRRANRRRADARPRNLRRHLQARRMCKLLRRLRI